MEQALLILFVRININAEILCDPWSQYMVCLGLEEVYVKPIFTTKFMTFIDSSKLSIKTTEPSVILLPAADRYTVEYYIAEGFTSDSTDGLIRLPIKIMTTKGGYFNLQLVKLLSDEPQN